MARDVDELRGRVGAAYLQLRAMKNTCRDTLAAVAALQDDLEPIVAELLPHLLDGTAKEAQPDEQESRSRPRDARCLA